MAPSSSGSEFTSTVKTVLLGVMYITFASSRILFTKHSSNEDNQYEYLPATVIVSAEALKLLVCSFLFFHKISKESNVREYLKSFSHQDILNLWPWSIPAFLYFIDNLMTFYVIASFETAMVVLLNNFVIISTSLLFKIILKHKFTRIQWGALFILFLSIVSLSKENFSSCVSTAGKRNVDGGSLSTLEKDVCHALQQKLSTQRDCSSVEIKLEDFSGYFLVLVQCFIASTANVYNEKIFKQGNAFNDSIYIQNSKLYTFGVIFNSALLLIRSDYRQKVLMCGLFHGFNRYAFLLIIANTALGLTISLVLKHRDNMFHIMCSQLNTVFVITVSILFTNFEPTAQFFLQAPIVLLSIYIYHLAKKDKTGEKDVTHPGNNVSGRISVSKVSVFSPCLQNLLQKSRSLNSYSTCIQLCKRRGTRGGVGGKSGGEGLFSWHDSEAHLQSRNYLPHC
ncbi:putative UDP-sugar transporter protein SLC35A5 [Holothuria leucospilota]|uniref:UDP-sugar transporter protein SLC35A5 n=1 Tax=Holothuria leucospilota TaxID=206669 RepID=A0A9Q1BQK8_HOLLE|nr:putative UDP-sugar transporter protein SLC35A5 [Holothuria leucospilota]